MRSLAGCRFVFVSVRFIFGFGFNRLRRPRCSPDTRFTICRCREHVVCVLCLVPGGLNERAALVHSRRTIDRFRNHWVHAAGKGVGALARSGDGRTPPARTGWTFFFVKVTHLIVRTVRRNFVAHASRHCVCRLLGGERFK